MSYRLLIIFLASSAEMGENRLKVLPSTAICDASSLPPSSSYIFLMTVAGTLPPYDGTDTRQMSFAPSDPATFLVPPVELKVVVLIPCNESHRHPEIDFRDGDKER